MLRVNEAGRIMNRITESKNLEQQLQLTQDNCVRMTIKTADATFVDEVRQRARMIL